MSAWTTLEAVRQGKSRDVKVTAEVCPHDFTLTDEMLAAPIPYDTNTKMNPPLREARDRDAMLAGIADGSVDVIATDHAPHHYDEKNVEFDRAPFGIVGLETAIPICLDRLVRGGVIRLSRLVELMSVNPARILKVAGGSLAPGMPADITVLAPELSVTIDRAALRSKSKNTPYHGWTFTGGVAATIVGGRVVHAGADAGWPTRPD
jgi:dihydroorotase